MNKAMRNPAVYIAFILPAVVLIFMFFIYPIFSSIYYSFTSWNGVSAHPKWIGAENYIKALGDERFWRSALNNLWFIVFSIGIQVPLIIVFSLLIANVRRLQGLYKTAVFLPSIMSTAVIGILWGFIYEPNIGLMNRLLGLLGIDPVFWLSDEKHAMLSILITNAWQWTGFYIVMVLAAILAVPRELGEAAAIDGASRIQQSVHVILPLIRPIISVVVMLSIAGAMKAADIVIVMTKGGPAGSTDVLATYMIKYAITNFKYGYGNTVAVLIFAITLVLTVLYHTIFARRSERVEF